MKRLGLTLVAALCLAATTLQQETNLLLQNGKVTSM